MSNSSTQSESVSDALLAVFTLTLPLPTDVACFASAGAVGDLALARTEAGGLHLMGPCVEACADTYPGYKRAAIATANTILSSCFMILSFLWFATAFLFFHLLPSALRVNLSTVAERKILTQRCLLLRPLLESESPGLAGEKLKPGSVLSVCFC